MSKNEIDLFGEINGCKYFYLDKISEPSDNSLKLIIIEAVIGEESTICGSDISGNVITVSEDSKNFEIYFDSYIGYSVVDESYSLPDDSDIYNGRIFRIYKKSNYLNYLSKASFACDDHPGPFTHYGFNCLNHIIDIASADEPEIKML